MLILGASDGRGCTNDREERHYPQSILDPPLVCVIFQSKVTFGEVKNKRFGTCFVLGMAEHQNVRENKYEAGFLLHAN